MSRPFIFPPVFSSKILLLLVAAGLNSWVSVPARAGAILDLTFDDPQALVRSKPEGISTELAGSKSTIASGSGGRALPQITEGPAHEREGRPTEARIFLQPDTSMGTSAFLQLILEANSVTRNVGVGVMPDGLESSLSALVSYENGMAFINGALDFFFRVAVEGGATPKLGIRSKCGILGFNVDFNPTHKRLLLQGFTSSKCIDIDGDKTPDKAEVNARSVNEVALESGAVYHAAIVFRTSPEGIITMDVCLKEGTGALIPGESVIATLTNFQVVPNESRRVADKITINLGQHQMKQVLDIAAFRIFKPAPETFPGVAGRE